VGTRCWRMRRVEAGRVRVEDAQGAPPTVPFWLGEAPARTRELSAEVSRLREEVAAQGSAALPWLDDECGLPADGGMQLIGYLGEAQAALGAMPSVRTLVAEPFFHQARGLHLLVHAPFGGRINRALGLALRKRFCVTFPFQLHAP